MYGGGFYTQVHHSCLLHLRSRHTDSVLGSSETAAVTMSHPRSSRKNSSFSRTLFVSGGWKSRQEYNIFICPLSFQCVFICVIECIGFWVSTSCPLILRWKNIFGPPLSIWAQVRLFIHCFCQFAHFLSTSLRYFLKQGQKCFLISLKIFSSASA